jgi:hypothetical protein
MNGEGRGFNPAVIGASDCSSFSRPAQSVGGRTARGAKREVEGCRFGGGAKAPPFRPPERKRKSVVRNAGYARAAHWPATHPPPVIPAQAGIHSANLRKCAIDVLDCHPLGRLGASSGQAFPGIAATGSAHVPQTTPAPKCSSAAPGRHAQPLVLRWRDWRRFLRVNTGGGPQ